MAHMDLVADKPGKLVWSLIYASAILFVAFFMIQTLWQYRKLQHFKGPPGAGLSKWWLIRNQIRGDMNTVLGGVSEKYGSLARIGPKELVTDDPDIIRRMTGVRSKYTRSDWYDVMKLDPNKPNVLSHRDDEEHNKLRTKMAAGYSGKEVVDLESCIDRQIAKLVQLIDSKCASKLPIDFARTAEFFTLDVISDIAFGEPFGFMSNDSDIYDYIKTTEETLPFAVLVGVLPSLNQILQIKALNKLFMPSIKDKLGLGRIMGILKDVVATRYGSGKISQKDMLGSFVHHGLTQAEAESEVLVQILAGSDTTATAMRITLLHLITAPQIYNKLIRELSSASKSNQISQPIKEAEAKRLAYLQAVITEGLRIHPPVTGLGMKEVPKEGDTINGQFVPGGTKIATSYWGLFRNKKIWGDDAHEFRPERWIEAAANPEKLQMMENVMDMVFSWGRYQCLGKPIAYLELNKVFVELLRNFDFGFVDPMKPLLYTYCIGLFIQKDMFLKVTRREEAF